MIQSTTQDLENHLKDIDNKLETHVLQGTESSTDIPINLERIQAEEDSAEQCLDICAKVSRLRI